MISQLSVASALCAGLVLCGCATTGGGTQATEASALPLAPCAPQAPSRLDTTRSNCAAYGRSYSRSDIAATGATSFGDALRLLDPGITVGH